MECRLCDQKIEGEPKTIKRFFGFFNIKVCEICDTLLNERRYHELEERCFGKPLLEV